MRDFPRLCDLSYGPVETIAREIRFDEVPAGGRGEDSGLATAEELGDAKSVVLGRVRCLFWPKGLAPLTIVAVADDDQVTLFAIWVQRYVVVA
jgi:hypothetical protein